jgi:hypothetical protein
VLRTVLQRARDFPQICGCCGYLGPVDCKLSICELVEFAFARYCVPCHGCFAAFKLGAQGDNVSGVPGACIPLRLVKDVRSSELDIIIVFEDRKIVGFLIEVTLNPSLVCCGV